MAKYTLLRKTPDGKVTRLVTSSCYTCVANIYDSYKRRRIPRMYKIIESLNSEHYDEQLNVYESEPFYL